MFGSPALWRQVCLRRRFLKTATIWASLCRLRCAFIDAARRHHKVDPPIRQRFETFGGFVDDRLFVNVEAGINQNGKAAFTLEGGWRTPYPRIYFIGIAPRGKAPPVFAIVRGSK